MENNIQIIADEFGKIKSKISKKDRLEAALNFEVCEVTVARYLRGTISKEPFALELLAFFKKIITKRESVLPVAG